MTKIKEDQSSEVLSSPTSEEDDQIISRARGKSTVSGKSLPRKKAPTLQEYVEQQRRKKAAAKKQARTESKRSPITITTSPENKENKEPSPPVRPASVPQAALAPTSKLNAPRSEKGLFRSGTTNEWEDHEIEEMHRGMQEQKRALEKRLSDNEEEEVKNNEEELNDNEEVNFSAKPKIDSSEDVYEMNPIGGAEVNLEKKLVEIIL